LVNLYNFFISIFKYVYFFFYFLSYFSYFFFLYFSFFFFLFSSFGRRPRPAKRGRPLLGASDARPRRGLATLRRGHRPSTAGRRPWPRLATSQRKNKEKRRRKEEEKEKKMEEREKVFINFVP